MAAEGAEKGHSIRASWCARCKSKLTTLDQAIALIKPNEAIYASACAAARATPLASDDGSVVMAADER